MNVDAMAMMNAENPAERMDMLRKSFEETGRSVNDLSRHELKLLSESRAKKLFISGVYKGVDVRRLLQIFEQNSTKLYCCVELGHAAESTEGNAIETREWIKKESYTSIRLVTSNYHMPRSIRLFSYHMPGIHIIPQPVFPDSFKGKNWWLWKGTSRLIILEYNF